MAAMTWEEAVQQYRERVGNTREILNNYFDLPVLHAARRFAQSDEFACIARLLGPGTGRTVLDLGAGNGIACYAFARNDWQVIAIEPDPSTLVGAAAIRTLASIDHLPIEVISAWGEELPLADNSVDVVFGRQVLHHASNLDGLMRQVARVVRPGGKLMFTREHVVNDDQQLATFLKSHPLHALYGGENAFPLTTYRYAFTQAQLQLESQWGPLDSILNYFPGRESLRQRALWREHITELVLNMLRCFPLLNSSLPSWRAALLRNSAPGRLYSFLLSKPEVTG